MITRDRTWDWPRIPGYPDRTNGVPKELGLVMNQGQTPPFHGGGSCQSFFAIMLSSPIACWLSQWPW